MYPPEKDTRIGGADSEYVLNLKRNLIEAFEKMAQEPTAEKLDNLWKEIEKVKIALSKDLEESINQYEAKTKVEDSKEN